MAVSGHITDNSGVYQILNTITGKSYIGSSCDLEKRGREHVNRLRAKTHDNRYLQNSFNKHGGESFLFIPFHFCDPDKLMETEQFWLDALDAVNTGYNVCFDAKGGKRGLKHSRETREKLKHSKDGKKYPRMSAAAKARDPAKRARGPRSGRIMFRCRVCGAWKEMLYSRYVCAGGPKYCSRECWGRERRKRPEKAIGFCIPS